MARYRCTVCNWVYDEEVEGKPFSDVSESFHCPRCGAPKTAFAEVGLTDGRSKDVATTVADNIVSQLVALGVKTVYGIPGDSNLPLIEAIRSDGRIRFVLTRHEETAAFMASAHGKMTGKLGVCISIAGPGVTNLITGLIDAAADCSPVLAIVGQVPEVYLGSEAFQEIDQLELLHPFAAFAETVARPSQATRLVMMAAKHALARPGVGILSTPTDVLAEHSPAVIYSPHGRLFEAPTSSDPGSIAKAVELIDECHRPVLLAGWGARNYGEELLALAERLHAPIATTSRAKGTVAETDRRTLGVLGSIGSKYAAQMIQTADLLIIVGSGFRHANLVPEGVHIIQIDRDPTRIGRTFDVDAGIVGDAGFALRTLTRAVHKKPTDSGFWERLDQLRALHQDELDADATDRSIPIHPGFVIRTLNRQVADDAIICCDVGDHTYWFYKKFQCYGQKTFLSANVASMGFALPAALSAQIDFPARQVVALTGDGGFAMLASDITTAVRERLPITVIVFNDGKLKNIVKEQARDGYPEFGVSFPNPDFAAFARSAGADGFRVEEPDQLDEALSRALASDRPAVVEVLIDPRRMAAATKQAGDDGLS